MFPKITCLAAIAVFLLSGCSKQITEPAAPDASFSSDKSVALSLPSLEADRGWYGFYGGPDVFNSDTLFAPDIIKGGVIKLPYYSDARDVFVGIDYDILPDHILPGDSIIYELELKNPKDDYHSDWDVAIDIKGTTGEAHVGFVADNEYSQYTQFFVGNTIVTGLPQLVYDFENFTKLSLILKNNHAAIKLNGKQLYSFVYGAQNRIGQIKNISMGGKGTNLTCTAVKLRNSYSNKELLTENFNTDGQSTVVYH